MLKEEDFENDEDIDIPLGEEDSDGEYTDGSTDNGEENNNNPDNYNLDPNEDSPYVTTGEVDDPRPYTNPTAKTLVSVGQTTLSLAQAKLFGFKIAGDGTVLIPEPSEPSHSDSLKAIEKVNSLSTRPPSKPLEPSEEDIECKFKPAKSKEAQSAMLNPRCGYDFVSRLNERGDFLDRAGNKGDQNKAAERETESKKMDYEAKVDKLTCPTCHRFQSFDEYSKKQRNCTLCNIRFVQSKSMNPGVFLCSSNLFPIF